VSGRDRVLSPRPVAIGFESCLRSVRAGVRIGCRIASGANIPTWIMLPIAVLAVLALVLTTATGKRWAAWLGIPSPFRGGVPPDTRDHLLKLCGGDRKKMSRRLDVERQRYPALDEAALYRRAMRTAMNERAGASDPDVS
jgi:hypothetical protein